MQTPPAQNGQQAEALDRLMRLQALTASLSEAVTSGQVADATLGHSLSVLGAVAGVVYSLSDDGTELVCLRMAGYPAEVADAWGHFPADARTPVAEAVRHGRPVVVSSLAEMREHYPDAASFPTLQGEAAGVALPLLVRGRAIGGLGLRFPTERTFSEQDRAFLMTIAGLCAQALERAPLYDTERSARGRAEQAEQALRESEERLRAIMDNCPSAVFVKDPHGRYLLANKACEAYSREPSESVIGKTAHDYFPPGLADHLGAEDRQVLETGEALRYEAVMPAQGGTLTALTVKFPLRDAGGRPYAVCGIATDITELKRATEALRVSEERFARFMQHLPGLAWIKDEQGRYVYANDAALNAFGKPRADVSGKADEEVFPPATAAQFRENDRKALASGTGVRVVETLEHADGVPHHSLVSKFPIPGPDGKAALVGGMAIDITEEVRTRAVLEESEQRFRATFEQAAVGLAHVGLDGRWLRVNKRLCDTVGYAADELLGLTFQDITHPDDLEADLAHVRRLLAGEIETYSMEKRYFRKDRSLVWINLTVSLVRTPEARPKYFISVVEDITEIKKAQDALRESEGRVRAVLESITDAFFALGRDWRFTYVNRQAEEVLERRPGDLLGKNIWEEYPGLAGSEFERAYRRVMAERVAASATAFYPDHQRWYEVHVYPAEDGISVYFRDVSDRVRADEALRVSEERFRTLFETMDEGYCVIEMIFDPPGGERAVDYRFLEVNPAFEAQAGMRDATGRRMLEFVPSIEEHWLANYGRVALTGEPIRFANEYTGLNRWFEVYAFRVGGPGSRRVGVLFTDITRRRRAEDDRERLVGQLRDADRRKDEFLATLAHELRNPLAPLRNGLQVMKLAAGNAEAVEQARGMMERQFGTMVRLVDDLLDVSRITRGKLQLRPERVELASVVQSAVEGSRPLIESNRHDLTIRLPAEAVYLEADPTRLAQVFSNLLTNAAKYTDRGGRITLTAERRNGEVVVSVRDTGIGIAPDHLPRLFEMFSQVDSALERSQGGLGIGLSLVKGLVKMHGGSVEARSEGLGKGSEFVVRLPVPNESPARQTQQPGGDEGGAARRRILVADDNRDAADSLALLLRLAGHEVHAAHDGQEAVEAAAWFRPDVALLDIGMPKLNGYEACRRIREQPGGRGVVLVALTGWGQEDDKRRAAEAGFDHHLTKPVDPADLERLLARPAGPA